MFEVVHDATIEIGDVTNARPEGVTPRPVQVQQRLQWTAPLNPINQRITTSPLVRYLPDQKGVTSVVRAGRGGIECCASGYPELKSFQ